MESGLRRNEGLTRKKQTFRVGSLGSGAGELIDGNRPTIEGSVYVLPPSAQRDTILDLSRVPRKNNQVIEIINRSPSYRIGIKGFTSLDGVIIEEHKVVMVLSNTTLRVMWTGVGRAVIKVEPINGLTGFIDWEFGYGSGEDGSGDSGVLPTPLDPTYSIVPDTIAVVEGYPVTFTVSTTNVSSGTVLYWKAVAPTGKAIQGNDFVDGALTGSITISTTPTGENSIEVGSGTIVREIAEDGVAELGNAFTLELKTDSVLGSTVAVSPIVTIVDSVGDGGSVAPIYTLTSDTITVVEGGTIGFTLIAMNAPSSGTYTYNILHGDTSGNPSPTINKMTNAYDFMSYATSGTFSPTFNPYTQITTGSFSINVTGDILVEGNEYFRVQVKRDGSPIAVSQVITIVDLLGEPQPAWYSITGNIDSVLEGGVVNFVVSTTNVASGTTLGWRVKEGSGVVESDFVDRLMSGSIVISNGSANFSRSISSDTVADGNEVFAIELLRDGLVVASTQEITIINIEEEFGTPIYNVIGNKTEVNEGESITFTIVTTNVGDGTKLWWRLKYLNDAQIEETNDESLVGLVPLVGYELIGAENLSLGGRTGGELPLLVNGQTSVTIGIKPNIIIRNRVFAIEILTGGIGDSIGNVVAVSSIIRVKNVINQTSGYTVTPDKLSVNEGGVVTFTVNGINIPDGTVVLWQLGEGSEITGEDIEGSGSGSLTMQDGEAVFSIALKDEVTITQKNLIVEIRESDN